MSKVAYHTILGIPSFVSETTGAVNQAGQRLVRKLLRAEALHSDEDPAELLDSAWHSMVSAVARAVACHLTKACTPEWMQPVSDPVPLPAPAGAPLPLGPGFAPYAPAAALPPAQPGVPVQVDVGASGPADGNPALAHALCR